MHLHAVDVILLGFAAVLGLWGTPLVAECIAAAFPPRRGRQGRPLSRPPADILIPARNEADILPTTLSALTPQLIEADRVWVIADNCTDETADVARSLGAQVLERRDAARRGKGFALQHAIDRIDPRDGSVAVIVDADCRFEPGSLAPLVTLAARTQQPVQSRYQMLHAGSGARSGLSQFAILLKNTVRQRGLSQMGLPCLLSGSGMAFEWRILKAADLANDNTADDLQFTCDLALAGRPVLFCEASVVTAMLPNDPHVADVQRKRWIHGHLRTAARYVPRLVWQGVRRGRLLPIFVAMEVAVPPLSLLALLHAALGGLCIAWGGWSGSWWPACASLASTGLIVSAIWLAWWCHGRLVLPWTGVKALPFHILRTLAASVELLFRRQHWTPTRRDVEFLHHDG